VVAFANTSGGILLKGQGTKDTNDVKDTKDEKTLKTIYCKNSFSLLSIRLWCPWRP
jgi:hypothetical protein